MKITDCIPNYPKVSQARLQIYAELARRYILFHADEDPHKIRLWGLAQWGHVSKYLKTGEMITGMKKENRTIWFRPRPDLIETHILPLVNNLSVEELRHLSGWR